MSGSAGNEIILEKPDFEPVILQKDPPMPLDVVQMKLEVLTPVAVVQNTDDT